MTRPPAARTEAGFPDPGLRDAGVALISPWGGADEADRFRRAHRDGPPGLLGLTRFRAVAGGPDLHYARWADDESCLRWLDDGDAPPARYTLHRSYRAPGAARGPGLLATPRFACTGPAVQRRLAEAIVAVLTDLTPPGLLAAHLHLSVDGSRLVNYAEWTDEPAWQSFVNGPASPRMRSAFDALPGVTLLNTPQGVARYRPTPT